MEKKFFTAIYSNPFISVSKDHYLPTQYIDYDAKVVLWCEKHDKSFWLSHHELDLGCGCPDCWEEKVEEIKAMYPGLRSQAEDRLYAVVDADPRVLLCNETVYTNNKTKAWLWCKIHNKAFSITPNQYLSGQGCMDCGTATRCAKKSAIGMRKLFEKVSNDPNVDIILSGEFKTVYTRAITKLWFWCKIHNKAFSITPNQYLSGQGCMDCGRDSTNAYIAIRSKEAGGRFFEVVSNDPNVDIILSGEFKTVYTINKTKVWLWCKIHNKAFSITPADYLSGHGCSDCGRDSANEYKSVISKEAGGRFFEVVSNDPNVDIILSGEFKTVYVGAITKVWLWCKIHNKAFSITPHNYLGGQGCAACAKYGFDPEKPAIFYLALWWDGYKREDVYKYGITNRTFKERSSEQARDTELELCGYTTWHFESGHDAKYCEDEFRKVRDKLGGPYLTKEVFPDGYTETIQDLEGNATWEDHLEHLFWVLGQRFEKMGVKIVEEHNW